MSDKPAKTTKPTAPDVDPTLDITSEQFDPLKALYARADLLRPVKNARLYDNICKYESSIAAQPVQATASAGDDPNKQTVSAPKPSTSSQKAPVDDLNPFQRKFQPHQLMLPGTGPKARHKRNLVDRIDERRFDGPLAALTQLMADGARVKVYTRNAKGILGHMTGNIELFDKHWNMVLSDVHEVWKRRKAHQCETAQFDDSGDIDCTRRMRELRLRVPQVTVKSLNRKYVECSRRLAKAMVRGEQVVLVASATASKRGDKAVAGAVAVAAVEL